jgi:hypothetical protein
MKQTDNNSLYSLRVNDDSLQRQNSKERHSDHNPLSDINNDLPPNGKKPRRTKGARQEE